MKEVAIYGLGSISALGSNPEQIHNSYLSGNQFLQKILYNGKPHWVGALNSTAQNELDSLIANNRHYRRLDRSVLMGIFSARQAMARAGWQADSKLAIQFGSSRGATETLERSYQEFLTSGKVSAACSPTTTLGNLSSWVGQDLGAKGAQIENSVTCSTGMHAILNAVAWLKSGMASKFLVGASEAPLTAFTLEQMCALGLYADDINSAFPCRPLDFSSQVNTLVLGEGACALCLACTDNMQLNSKPLAKIRGLGFAAESISSPTSISADGEAFYHSMQMAISQLASPREVDLILMHAPGTNLGDKAELCAVSEIFGADIPRLFSNKWALGHTFAASGLFSLEYALGVLEHGLSVNFPFPVSLSGNRAGSISTVLINSAGFGGNAVSILISR